LSVFTSRFCHRIFLSQIPSLFPETDALRRRNDCLLFVLRTALLPSFSKSTFIYSLSVGIPSNRKVRSSKLIMVISCRDKGFTWFSSVLPQTCWTILKQATTVRFLAITLPDQKCSASISYSKGPAFETQSGIRLSWLGFLTT
jgi:hypothetical protein